MTSVGFAEEAEPLRLSWEENILQIEGEQVPGGAIDVWYLEAFCRPGSTDREWNKTTIPHETRLISQNEAGTQLVLRSTLADGVIVDHTITSSSDEVQFEVVARNPTDRESEAHWAQPCMRVGEFTGTAEPAGKYEYVKKSFLFLEGKLTRMPTEPWATEARYVPGQVWAAPGVDRDDVNPRPLNPLRPSPGLIGCFSEDDEQLLAMAWEPYQELFQGVIRCLHSDFRIGGLKPGETKRITGRIYLLPNDPELLLKRYREDFEAE